LNDINERRMSMAYECDICGYVYKPEDGDPGSGIDAGTEFAALPDGWVCPECGADKDSFSEV